MNGLSEQDSKVLDKLAKERGARDWEHYIWKQQDAMRDICFDTKEELEELLLDFGRAECQRCLKEIDILIADDNFQEDMVLGELKKRLCAKEKPALTGEHTI